MNLQVQNQDQTVKKRSFRNFFSRRTSSSGRSSSNTVVSPHYGDDDRMALQVYSSNNAAAHSANQQASINQPLPLTREPPNRKGPNKYGLFRLDDPARVQAGTAAGPQYPIDIVAVHGMNGDAFDTWTTTSENGREVNWLRDFLPREFPGARVFSYGYPASTFWTRETGNITDAARVLLESLVNERFGMEHRPIVLIGHSMGGLVIKKALNICVTDGGDYTAIKSSTKSIFFFATPHGGSAFADTAASFAMISNLASLGISPFRKDVFKTLKIDSRELYDISMDFRHHLTADLGIYSFLEEQMLPGLKSLIVTQMNGSTGAPREQLIKMAGYDHRSIVRFQSREDSGYRAAVGPLKRAVNEAIRV